MFAALLDTSVLWPSLQRDFLLSLAIEGLYRPLWSSAILAELEYHETHKLIDRGEQLDVAARRARHRTRKSDGEWAGRRHPAEPGHVVVVRVWRLGGVVGDDRFAAADEDLLTRDRLQLGSQVAGAALGVDPRFEVTRP